MNNRLLFILKTILFWLCVFLFFKIAFLIIYYKQTLTLTHAEIFQVFWYGLRSDLSLVGYVSTLYLVLGVLSIWLNKTLLNIIIQWFTYVLLFVICFISVGDLELYGFWGFRVDTTPLIYINTPKEMVASVSYWVVFRDLSVIGLFTVGFGLLYNKFILRSISWGNPPRWFELPILLAVIFGLFVAIRGGLGLEPLRPGSTYFSKKVFANHATINACWNAMYSLTEMQNIEHRYKYLDDSEAASIVSGLYKNRTAKAKPILRIKKPNVLIIIMESFTAKVVGPLGGLPAVTPRFNALVKEGILFRNFYASGSQSDKGLIAILSGFPALPRTSAMRYPERTQRLPALSLDLKKKGYSTAFYYGGNTEFFSMQSYLQNTGFNSIVNEKLFPSSQQKNKWGVNDSIMFERVAHDLDTLSKPFFCTFFTLSCHDPYDIPGMPTRVMSKPRKFICASTWVDNQLGRFIDYARQSAWWDSTLIIITADHGSILPWYDQVYMPQRFHLPLLFCGGALSVRDTVIEAYASQTDIAFTLLDQLNIQPTKPYLFSRNLLSNDANFCVYIYNNGVGFMSDTAHVVLDCTSNKIVSTSPDSTLSALKTAKAYIQQVFTIFLSKDQ